MRKKRTRQEVQKLTAKIVELKKQFTNQEIAEKLGIKISYINDLMWKHNKKMKKANITDIVSSEFERLGAEKINNESEKLLVIVYDPETLQQISIEMDDPGDNTELKRQVLNRLEIAIKI
jgi:predicted XRE-type DNA-binding protein